MPLAGREKRRLILRQEGGREEASPRKRKAQVEALRAENEAIRGEVFRLREKNTAYEKKLLGLVEEFRERKQTYLEEIKRLTIIIKTTVQELPTLLLEQSIRAGGGKSGGKQSQQEASSEFNNTITSYFNALSQASESKVALRPSSVKKVSSLHWLPPNPIK